MRAPPVWTEVSFAQIEERGLEAWLAGLREELVSTTYRPDPVRRSACSALDAAEHALDVRRHPTLGPLGE
jgi:RNA-directed DNA polymerase